MTLEHMIEGTEDAWDSGALGTDANFAQQAPPVDETAIDDALELQMISIRLQKSLIEDFKLIGKLQGVGYQPLMRQVLKRFADCEKKRILREYAADVNKRQELNDSNAAMELRSGTDG